MIYGHFTMYSKTIIFEPSKIAIAHNVVRLRGGVCLSAVLCVLILTRCLSHSPCV